MSDHPFGCVRGNHNENHLLNSCRGCFDFLCLSDLRTDQVNEKVIMPSPIRSRTRRLFVVSLLALNGLLLISYISLWRGLHENDLADFISFYAAGTLPPQDLYNLERQREVQIAVFGHPAVVNSGVLPFTNPPVLAAMLHLVVNQDFVASYSRWAFVLTLTALLCAIAVYFLLKDMGWLSEDALLAATTALVFLPLFSSIVKGESTALVLLGFLLFTRFLLKGSSILAGAFLCLTLIKPHFAVFIFLPVLMLDHKAALSFLVGSAVLASASVLFVGVSGAIQLLEIVRLIATSPDYGASITTQYNLLSHLLWFGVPVGLARATAWTMFLLVPVLLALRFRGKGYVVARIAIMLSCAVFFAPHLHFHDLGLLILPLALGVTLLRRRMYSSRFQRSALSLGHAPQ
jgi:hypothetical protein